MKKFRMTGAFLALVLVASLMLAAVPRQTALAGPPTDAYKKLLKNLKGSYKVPCIDGYNTNFLVKGAPKTKTKKVSLDYFKYYIIKDVNQDGVNDLLLSHYKSTTGRGKVLVLTYKNKKVVPVFYAKGIRGGVFLGSNKRLVFIFGNSTYVNNYFTKLDGDKLKLNHDVTYSRQKKDEGGYKYFKGKTKIKKKAYKAAVKEIGTELKFEKIK